jgi:hypothetical protein
MVRVPTEVGPALLKTLTYSNQKNHRSTEIHLSSQGIDAKGGACDDKPVEWGPKSDDNIGRQHRYPRRAASHGRARPPKPLPCAMSTLTLSMHIPAPSEHRIFDARPHYSRGLYKRYIREAPCADSKETTLSLSAAALVLTGNLPRRLLRPSVRRRPLETTLVACHCLARKWQNRPLRRTQRTGRHRFAPWTRRCSSRARS